MQIIWHYQTVFQKSFTKVLKIMYFLRDMIKIASDQTVIPTLSVIFMENLHKMLSVFNKSIDRKNWKDSLAILCYDSLKSLK